MTDSAEERVVLALGFGPGTEIEALAPAHMRVVSRPCAALDAHMMAEIRPCEVLTPLLGRACDAGAIAQKLSTLGFTGTLRVMCPPLPDTAMVQRELAGMGPGMTIRLIVPN